MIYRLIICITSCAMVLGGCDGANQPGQNKGEVVTGGMPAVLHYDGGTDTLVEGMEVVLTKTPAGYIEVGKGFTVTVSVSHITPQPGKSEKFGTNPWGLRYGQLFQVMGTNHAVTPTYLNDLPQSVLVAAGSAWQGSAHFKCRQVGMSLLRYRGHVRWPFNFGDAHGTALSDAVSGDLKVYCTAATGNSGSGTSVTTTPGAVRVGPVTGTDIDDPYGEFVVRIWRSPAGDDIPVGTAVNVHIEVENTTQDSSHPANPSTPGWALAGILYQQFGSALTPRRYREAPAVWVYNAALATWSGDYHFTCAKAGVSQLRYNGNIYTDFVNNASTSAVTVTAEPFKCIDVEEVGGQHNDGEGADANGGDGGEADGGDGG